ncbi:hypothetical protein FACS18948_6650 [Clostridia bacterium]|nr:hypothetical protein FACS18948_6650 [Clostridia bacterium]
MVKAKAADVAWVALEWAAVQPPIPYKSGGASRTGADCQGFVKACIAETGGKVAYSGSNAMFRACLKAGAWWTFAEAKKQGKIVQGALPFMWDSDGGEVARGYKDGLGNASHVGIYVGLSSQVWSVDASESAGCVRTRTERDAPHVWTHIGWLPEIEYTKEKEEQAMPNESAGMPAGKYIVIADSGATVNMRSAPSDKTDNRIALIPVGDTVNVLESAGNGWVKAEWKGKRGYIRAAFMVPDGEQDVETIPKPEPSQSAEMVTLEIPASVAQTLWEAMDAAGVMG